MFNGVLGTIKGVKMKADKRDLVLICELAPPPGSGIKYSIIHVEGYGKNFGII